MTTTHLMSLLVAKQVVTLILSNGTYVLVPLIRNVSTASLRRSAEQNWKACLGGLPPHVTIIKASDAVGVCATHLPPKEIV